MLKYPDINAVLNHLDTQAMNANGVNVNKNNVYQIEIGTNAGDMVLIGSLGEANVIVCNLTANIEGMQSKVCAISELPPAIAEMVTAANLQYVVGYVQSFYGRYRVKQDINPAYYALHEINEDPTALNFITYYNKVTHLTSPTKEEGGGPVT